MTVADNAVASDEDVQSVRQWVRLSCTELGTNLPALAEIGRISSCLRPWSAPPWSSSPPTGW
jgi:hypothetical protein